MDRTEVAALRQPRKPSSRPSVPHPVVPVATRTDSAARAGGSGARWVTLVAQQGGEPDGGGLVVAASEWHCGGRQGEGIKELYGGRAASGAVWGTGQARAGGSTARATALTRSAGVSSSRGGAWRDGGSGRLDGPKVRDTGRGVARTRRERRGGIRWARRTVDWSWEYLCWTARRRKPPCDA